ncbi:hypothetical protein [Microbacterium sp. No. 7]|uniref:hypothetical protein n=1 Tax=Microbacterium sp. No. 7 TaxID=1714373 RepID=UPI0006D129D8|nr:hypothetical protein [Microbacterium sp. No. 7]ALJ18866.1 hypothetical protein AOA12_02645 [Microbacterium sp. No. 7]
MNTPRSTWHRRIWAVTLAGGLAVAGLAACSSSDPEPSEPGGDAAPTAEGLAFGATKEEYIAAFADIEPITLQTQTGGAEGAPQNLGREAYIKAVEEWSGGKLKIEMAYANGIVAAATEADNALADGRLDISFSVLPSYEPDIYPVNTVLNDLSTVSPAGAFSQLVRAGWMSEAFATDEVFQAEMEEAGIVILLADQGSPFLGNSLFACAEPTDGSLSDLSGRSVSASGSAFTAQLTALGMSPITMPWNELYEGLERGVVDCGSGSFGGLQAASIQPVAQHGVIDQVPLAVSLSYVGVGQQVWEELPLVAKQLLFDRLDVFMIESSIAGMDGVASYLGDFATVSPLASDARSALEAANTALIEKVEAGAPDGVDVAGLQDLAEKWRGIVVDELGYGDTGLVEYAVDSSDYEGYDPEAFVTYLFEHVLADQRPAS